MQNQRVLLILSLFLVVFHARADELDDFIRSQMQKRRVPGLSLAIIRDGKILKAQAYGFIDKDGKVPVTTSTLFQAGTYQQPLPPEKAKLTATVHYSNRNIVEGRWHIYPEMAAAGLWTTPSDLARFAIGIQNANAGKSGNVLSQVMTRQMLTDQKNRDGLGVFLQGDSTTLRFGHNGRDEGFDALLTASAHKGYGIVIMINANDNSAMMGRIVDYVADYYHWDGFPVKTAKPVAVEVDSKNLKAFEGRYELFNNRIVTFEAQDRRLFALEDGFVDEEFVPVGNSKFTSTDRNVSVIFTTDTNGKVTGFTLKDDEQKYERKIPRIGPLADPHQTHTDPDPSRTPKITAALQAMVKGGKALEEAPGLTAGAKRDFAGGMREPETIKSLTFIHSENVAGRGIQRHDSDVSEIVTYQLKSDRPDTFIIVHLTSDGLVTDCDLVKK